jgi:hypothetical protein
MAVPVRFRLRVPNLLQKGVLLWIPESIPRAHTDTGIGRNAIPRGSHDHPCLEVYAAGKLVMDLHLCKKRQYKMVDGILRAERVEIKKGLSEGDVQASGM